MVERQPRLEAHRLLLERVDVEHGVMTLVLTRQLVRVRVRLSTYMIDYTGHVLVHVGAETLIAWIK